MVKIAIIISLVLCVLGLFFGFYNQILLSTCNITIERIPHGEGCLLPPAFMKDRRYIYSLSREGDQRVVAIIEGKKDGSVILNPRQDFGLTRYNYGPIPETAQLTRHETDILFGKPIEVKEDICTYRLKTPLPPTDRKSVDLDMRFQNEKLKEFRLRSKSLESSDWVKVKMVEGAVSAPST